MRIIGGTVKGRKLITPEKRGDKKVIRPTSARAREAIFNIIASHIENANVLDLFAGTGAMGLEALSRNARLAVFIDKSKKALTLISKNIHICNFSDRASIIHHDLSTSHIPIEKIRSLGRFDIIFMDPPYQNDFANRLLLDMNGKDVLNMGGLIVVETSHNNDFSRHIGSLVLFDKRRYGQAGFWLYEKVEE